MNQRLRIAGLCTLIVGMAALSACNGSKEKGAVIAQVGMSKIYKQDLEERIEQFPPQTQAFLQDKANKVKLLDQMVDEQVLVRYAKKEGIQRSEGYKSQLKDAKKQLLLAQLIQEKVDNTLDVGDEAIQQYYNDNKAQFDAVEQRRVAHILTKTKAEAEKARQELRAGKDFSAVAKKYSIDPSKDNGGELGWITRDQVVPEFANAAYAIKNKGRRTGIVKSQFGFHIIRLIDKNVRPKVTLEQAAPQIEQQLIAEGRQKAFDDMLKAAKADVKITKNVSEIE